MTHNRRYRGQHRAAVLARRRQRAFMRRRFVDSMDLRGMFSEPEINELFRKFPHLGGRDRPGLRARPLMARL